MQTKSVEKKYSFISNKSVDESARRISSGRIQAFKSPHRNSVIFENLLPVYQSQIYNLKKESTSNSHSNNSYKEFRESSIQCQMIDYRINVQIASCLTISTNAVFIPVEIRRFDVESKISSKENTFEKKSNNITTKRTISLREIGTQTYTMSSEIKQVNDENLLMDFDLERSKKTMIEICIEDIIYNVFLRKNLFTNKHWSILKHFIQVLEKLSEESVVFLSPTFKDIKSLNSIENLIRLNEENIKSLDVLLLKMSRNHLSEEDTNENLSTNETNNDFDIEKLIKMIDSKRKGVRFETSKEKRRIAIDRFKKSIRFVIINREWFKNVSKDKKDEREKLILEYNQIENSSSFLNGKKIQMLFNKEEFRSQKNLSSLITEVHKQILTKEQFARTPEQVATLLGLIGSIPRLNTLPKHVCEHVAQLMKLLIYEKGREIVREGHLAIGFYFIIFGSCDVLSIGVDSLLKVDELQLGDCFGDNSFQMNGITPHTVITNCRTELLTVVPADIDIYLNKIRLIEKQKSVNFISNFWPVKYWNWEQEHFLHFAELSEFLRFSKGDIIQDGSFQSNDKLYFVLKGNVELIRLLNTNLSAKENETVLKDITSESNYFFKKHQNYLEEP